MSYLDADCQKQVDGKWIYTGSFFHESKHERPSQKLHTINIQPREKKCVYLVSVFVTMLTAPGGQFDEDDTVYVDIYEIDGTRKKILSSEERQTAVMKPEDCPAGGVYKHHFGDQGDDDNQGISSFVGVIESNITFRIFIYGDDWVGASYFIMELGYFQ